MRAARRVPRWPLAALAVAVVAAIGIVVVLVQDSGDSGSEPEPPSGVNAASSLEGGPDEVLYMSGTTLIRRNVEKDTEEPVQTIPSPNVYAAPGSPWVAYVTSKATRDDDFVPEPVLHLYDPESDEKSGYGAGVAPVWNAAGTHVAFLRPVEARDCLGETCSGDVQIGVIEAETGRESLLLDPGNYSILDWAGDRVLVGDFASPSVITAVTLDDERTELDFPVSQFWDASPDGRWLVKTNAKKTEFVPFEGGELGDDRVPVELGDHELLEGSWSHDSSSVAAVVSTTAGSSKGRRGKAKDTTTEVITFSPDAPDLVSVEESFGATGAVLWSVDNESVVFARLVDPKMGLFQATHCPLGNEGECKIVTSWTEGVALLRTE